MNQPTLVFSVNYPGTEYSITMSRTAWEFREYQIENIKEHYPQTVYETLLSQFNEIKDRIGGYPVKTDTSAGTHKAVQA